MNVVTHIVNVLVSLPPLFGLRRASQLHRFALKDRLEATGIDVARCIRFNQPSMGSFRVYVNISVLMLSQIVNRVNSVYTILYAIQELIHMLILCKD